MSRRRPKPPSLVSMWMLDVFCCALGCVTLLWLLNNRVASDEARRAGRAHVELTEAQSDISRLRAALAAATDAERLAAGRAAALAEELRGTESSRDGARRDLAAAEAKIAAGAAAASATAITLNKSQQEAAELAKRLASTTVSSDELRRLLRQREAEAEAASAAARKSAAELRAAEGRAAALARAADGAAPKLRDLQAKLDDAAAQIIDLRGEKKRIADRFDRLKADADSRFAGIALTGRRVVLLVDVSGSMKLVDERTAAPTKWPTVVETVAKVLRSLPELEKVQVVTFSRTAQYLLGDGRWIDYRGEPTVREIGAALSATEPVGDTNLYGAFDLAFRLRPDGLDTVYLFSDGLPTSGPGLTAEQDRLPDAQRTELLARHIRRTLTATWNAGAAVKVNAVGFFYESPEVGAFLWALAREHNGGFVGMSRP